MDLTPNNTHTLETNTQTPPPTQPPNTKSLSFTNGSLKPHHSSTTTSNTSSTPPPPPPTVVISYKECLKNHAASIGGHALDGCGEFLPSSSSNPSEPRSLTCAACCCHRNFHRRDNNPNFDHSSPPLPLPLPRRGISLSTSSPSSLSPSPSSPPPISHHFPPSYAVPHMLLTLGNACSDDHQHRSFSFFNSSSVSKIENKNQSGKKRCRTKFSQEQKEKMHCLCEKLGWRMNKEDEGLIQEFCNEVGVSRGVFKVWMHNNKNIYKKRSLETLGNAPNDEKINGNHNDNDNDDGGRGGFDDSEDVNNSLEHN